MTTDLGNVARSTVAVLKNNGGDLARFRNEVLMLALDTGRQISNTLDDLPTAQLKAALQFLYGVVDAADVALAEEKGNANPESSGGLRTVDGMFD